MNANGLGKTVRSPRVNDRANIQRPRGQCERGAARWDSGRTTSLSADKQPTRNLAGPYEGAATGETFNAAGKTDILIRVENRNVFIAECKFWRGAKSFSEAVDQLLGYLSWRDSKCALLIFNPTKDSSAVRQKMHEVMIARTEHRKTVMHNPDGDSRYLFVKSSDPGREIHIHTMLFDMPRQEGG